MNKNKYINLEEMGNIGSEEIKSYLRSAIFYRVLYNFGFALRHRPRKSIERTMRELKQILNS